MRSGLTVLMPQLYSCPVSLADRYDGFLIDLDGVVWLGHEMIDGSAEALAALAAAGKPVAFVTNSPRITPAGQAAILRRNGVEIEPHQVVTAGSALMELARGAVGEEAGVFATGTPGFHEQVTAAGFEALPSERWADAAAVLVTGHDHFSYDELKAAAMAARAGAWFASTARDPTMPMPDGLWPGTGSILAAVEIASGKEAVVAGKPEKPIFEAGRRELDLPPEARVAMVGDRLDTDVGGAQKAGLEGILVAGNDSIPLGTGVTPDHEIESLSGLIA